MRKNFTLLISLIFLGMSSTIQAQLVTNGGDTGDGSLRQEIIDTPAGGTVTFDPSVTMVTLSSGDLDIAKDLTITGPSGSSVTVTANDSSRIFNITGGTVVLNNLTITDGTAVNGGGIYITNASVTINNSFVNSNIATGVATSSGGGIYNDVGGILIVNDSQISTNSANRAGGGIEDNSGAGLSITLSNVRMVSNIAMSSPGNGGALHITGAGDSDITGAELFNNTASAEGGGFWNGSGTMTISDSQILANTASGNDPDQGGGGVYNEGGNLIIQTNTFISTNRANGTLGSGGGVLNNKGTLTILDSAIESNTALRAGGGIEEVSIIGQLLTLTNVDLSDNSVTNAAAAPGNGGGLHVTGPGDSKLTSGQVVNNAAASEGGGLWNGIGLMIIEGTLISGNTARGNDSDHGGGGIYNNGGTLTVLRNTIIENNKANGTAGSGGGVFSTTGRVGFDRVIIRDNVANRAGGGIELINGDLLLLNTNLVNNNAGASPAVAAPGNGGGVHISGSAKTEISGGLIYDNQAASEGGGLWNSTGNMAVRRSRIYNNTASGNNADNGGAGIYNNGGNLTVTESSLSNNSASGTIGSGGAINNGINGNVNLTRSTVSGNSANGNGGGLSNDGATFNINAVTVANNTSGLTGGGIEGNNPVALKNTIVALNSSTVGDDVSGFITSNNYNLIGSDDLNVFTPMSNDLEGVDPLLGPLALNGSTTMTHALLDKSPAFDAGDPSDTFPDQRNIPVFGAARDIGSYEAQASLSISDFSETGIASIYPNPTTGRFFVEVGNSISKNLKLRIVSMTGQVMADFNMSVGKNEINVDGLSTGIYILNITDGNSKLSHKLIVQ